MTEVLNNLELDIMSNKSFNGGCKEDVHFELEDLNLTEEDTTALDAAFLDIESDLNKHAQPVCKMCEEEDSIPIYKDTCSKCHLNTHLHDLCKTEELELYNVVNQLQPTITDRNHLRSIMKLKRKLAEKLMSIDRFNPLIESICLRCKYNSITNRNLSFEENPHSLTCSKGHYFCSNCGTIPHTSAKKYHKTCEEYKLTRDKFKIPFIATWLSGIRNNEIQHKKTIELRELEQQSLDYLRKQDYRICPYTDYDSARKYEMSGTANNKLTWSHNKKNWHLVACKSIPVMKVNCSDMYCAKHNPERTRGTVVSQNHNGCGRRINWAYWKKINENFDKHNYSIYTMQQSDIADVTGSYGIIKKPKRCFICKKTTTCLHVKCTQHNCNFNNKDICGNCVVKSTTVPNIKQLINSIAFSNVYIDGAHVCLKFIKNIKEIFTCSFTCSDGKKLNLYIENSTGDIRYKDKTQFGIVYNFAQLSSENNHSIYLKKGERSSYDYGWGGNCSSDTLIDGVPVTNKYVVLNNYKCISNNHVLEFDGLESLQDKLSNIDQFKPYNNAAKKINQFLKRRYITNKWINLIANNKIQFEQIKQHIQVINSMLLRRKWKRVIKTVIKRLGTFETDAGDVFIDKPMPVECCIIC